METLPDRPLSYAELEELPHTTPVEAVRGHDEFRSYTGDDEEYRENHTDVIALVYDDTGRVTRYIPTVGWAVESQITLAPQDDRETVLTTLIEDWESGIF